jgi:hypothetical protein
MTGELCWPGMSTCAASVEDQRSIWAGDTITCQALILILFGDLFDQIFVHGAQICQREAVDWFGRHRQSPGDLKIFAVYRMIE